MSNHAARWQFKEVHLGEFKLHIAIDFGTDGLGIAYAVHDEVFVHTKWKSNRNREAVTDKPKTIILFDEKGERQAFGVDAKYTYMNLGPDAQREWMLFDRFKMSLFEDNVHNSNSVSISDTLTATNGKSYPSEKVFIAAYQYIAERSQKWLMHEKSLQAKKDEIQWIITVPAIWNDHAKDKMKEWAIKAGLVNPKIDNQCKIVYEPDSASLAMQYELKRQQIDNDEKQDLEGEQESNKYLAFSKGDKYVLVDAGGGTVDIACHEVLSDGHNGEYGVKEILHPSGGAWGSCYIDDEYVKLLETIFSKEWMDALKTKYPAVFTELVDEFQKAKETFFTDTETAKHDVELPSDFINFMLEKVDESGDDEQEQLEDIISKAVINNKRNLIKLEDERLEIDDSVWQQMFDRVLNPMIAHIRTLLHKPEMRRNCKYICLAGGFSASLYFQHRIQQEFGPQSRYNLMAIIPQKPILAVVQGAAYFGIVENYIKARVLKYSYGFGTAKEVETAMKTGVAEKWIEANSYFDRAFQTHLVDGLFSVVVAKGQQVFTGQYFSGKVDKNPAEKFTDLHLLCSDRQDPKTVMDSKEIGSIRIYHNPRDWRIKQVGIEYHFYDTMIEIYVFPEGKKHLKQKVKIKYSEISDAYNANMLCKNK
eukprot:CAMPEP_0197039208 /NCGR_PEP_ID=MMETSP1384-20130603/16028_1 /TAXON_ID=29189 /ORGANISM="Ammonia sp." /LENGTH=647 /DNA_ID=CAMNT_0042469763 /DNA_START=43 /DNA_END=1986 /DNA_ORIENTATION=+